MWKPSQNEPLRGIPSPEVQAPAHAVPTVETTNRNAAPAGDQAVISKGLFVKGEISGTESLYIDGKVEGSINLPGNRVTIGRNGTVVDRFDPKTKPDDPKVVAAIEQALSAK